MRYALFLLAAFAVAQTTVKTSQITAPATPSPQLIVSSKSYSR